MSSWRFLLMLCNNLIEEREKRYKINMLIFSINNWNEKIQSQSSISSWSSLNKKQSLSKYDVSSVWTVQLCKSLSCSTHFTRLRHIEGTIYRTLNWMMIRYYFATMYRFDWNIFVKSAFLFFYISFFYDEIYFHPISPQDTVSVEKIYILKSIEEEFRKYSYFTS